MNGIRMHGRARGFTLVELLTVVVIITILAGLAAAGIATGMKYAKTNATRQTATQIGMAFQEMYRLHGGDMASTLDPDGPDDTLDGDTDGFYRSNTFPNENNTKHYANNYVIVCEHLTTSGHMEGDAGDSSDDPRDAWGLPFSFKVFLRDTDAWASKATDWLDNEFPEDTLQVHSAGPDRKWSNSDDVVVYFDLEKRQFSSY